MPRPSRRPHKTDVYFDAIFAQNHGDEEREYYSTVNRRQFTSSLRFFDENAAAIGHRTARRPAAE